MMKTVHIALALALATAPAAFADKKGGTDEIGVNDLKTAAEMLTSNLQDKAIKGIAVLLRDTNPTYLAAQGVGQVLSREAENIARHLRNTRLSVENFENITPDTPAVLRDARERRVLAGYLEDQAHLLDVLAAALADSPPNPATIEELRTAIARKHEQIAGLMVITAPEDEYEASLDEITDMPVPAGNREGFHFILHPAIVEQGTGETGAPENGRCKTTLSPGAMNWSCTAPKAYDLSASYTWFIDTPNGDRPAPGDEITITMHADLSGFAECCYLFPTLRVKLEPSLGPAFQPDYLSVSKQMLTNTGASMMGLDERIWRGSASRSVEMKAVLPNSSDGLSLVFYGPEGTRLTYRLNPVAE